MKTLENLATLFLGSWLIIFGVQNLIHRTIPVLNELLPLLAVLAGLFLIITAAKLSANRGIILLAVWLIFKGLWPYLPLHGAVWGILHNGLAVAAGVIILIKR